MNVLAKRLHSCVLREVNYQINYQNKSKVVGYRRAYVTSNVDGKHDSKNGKKEKKIHIKVEEPVDVRRDWVGPADSLSNIRPLKLHLPADESPVERNYRLKREELVKWNHEFWAENNANFIKEKQEFIKKKSSGHDIPEDDNDSSQTHISPEVMSEFYREFLKKYYKKHFDYNMNWYKKNIQLLWPAFQVAVYGVKKKMFHRKP